MTHLHSCIELINLRNKPLCIHLKISKVILSYHIVYLKQVNIFWFVNCKYKTYNVIAHKNIFLITDNKRSTISEIKVKRHQIKMLNQHLYILLVLYKTYIVNRNYEPIQFWSFHAPAIAASKGGRALIGQGRLLGRMWLLN